MTPPDRLADCLAALAAQLGPGSVVQGEADMAAFATDWRRLFHGRPAAVVLPRSTGEVSLTLRLCHAAGIAVVPQGGNTGLAGGATPDASGGQIVLSLKKMDRIVDVDPLAAMIEVEAGCIVQHVQEAAARAGRLLPVSFAAEGSATIGGIIATNAGGLNVLRYGMTRSLVLGLEVVLADGTVLDARRALRKDNAGYDLKQLFIGSEGTLGIVTGAILRLAPRMTNTETALLALPDPAAALAVLQAAQEALGETLQACELISSASLDLVAKHAGLKSPLEPSPWSLLIEAGSCLPLREAMETFLGDCIERGLAADGVLAASMQQAASLWALRERITEAEGAEGRSVKHDVSVPIGRIPAFLEAASDAVLAAVPRAILNLFGHVGDGNIHFNVIPRDDTPADDINRIVHGLISTFGGSISAEHGIGQYRVRDLVYCRGPAELAFAAALKKLCDPENLLNPGKVYPTPSVT
jgi:FAD/FMN-containing dehydrogenase